MPRREACTLFLDTCQAYVDAYALFAWWRGWAHDGLALTQLTDTCQVETFIPMVLQSPDAATGKSRLKRVVLIGDHHQLPPVVKNAAFQKCVGEARRGSARFGEVGRDALRVAELWPDTGQVPQHHLPNMAGTRALTSPSSRVSCGSASPRRSSTCRSAPSLCNHICNHI